MITKTIILLTVTLVSITAYPIDVNEIKGPAKGPDQSSSKMVRDLIKPDLITAESGKALVFGGKKEDIIGKKGIIKGGKSGHKKLLAGGKKFSKKLGNLEGKKLKKKFLKKDNKVGAFGAVKKGFKKFKKKQVFNKIGGAGYKKKSFHVKSFNDNKAFKFGKVNGFKVAAGLASGLSKKGGKLKDTKLLAFDKKLKGGKKQFIDVKGAKGLKKLSQGSKAGFKKGGAKFLKKKLKGGKKLKKIG